MRKLIYERAGISLSEAKQDMVYSRLARRLRARGLLDFADYLALLDAGDEAEWEAFTNALTTNLTSFFREEHHFPILAEHALRQQRAAATTSGARVLDRRGAVLHRDDAGRSVRPDRAPMSILASDLDTQVLAKAAEGVYPLERIERLERRARAPLLPARHRRAGRPGARAPGAAQHVSFQRINLLEPSWPVHGPFDAIFCRNVMIYFDKPTQATILRRFAPLLRPDGLLFAGHSESLFHVSDVFRLRGQTVYERVIRDGRAPVRPRAPSSHQPLLRPHFELETAKILPASTT